MSLLLGPVALVLPRLFVRTSMTRSLAWSALPLGIGYVLSLLEFMN